MEYDQCYEFCSKYTTPSITEEEAQKCRCFFEYFLTKCKSDDIRLRHLMCYIDIRQDSNGR